MAKIGGPFSNDSKIGGVIGKLLSLCGVNLLWCVSCLPVITAGAATCAMHGAVNRIRDDNENVFGTYFATFKKCFGRATGLWAAMLVILFFLTACFNIVSKAQGTLHTVLFVVFSMPAMILAMVLTYSFPLLVKYSGGIADLVVDCVLLSVSFFPKTIIMLLLNVLPLLVIIFMPSGIVCAAFVWIPAGFALSALWIEQCLDGVYEKIG